MPDRKRYYVTTAIAYPNNKPGLHTLYEVVGADVIARWHRMKGDDTRFLTGTDEHSVNIATRARELGRETREFVDEIVELFKDAEAKLSISADRFIRTTDPDHARAAQEMVRRAHANGDVYLGSYEGWYCPNEGFKAPSDLVEDARGFHCPNHPDVELQWLTERNWFFRLSAFGDRLLRYYDEHPDWVEPEYRKIELLSFIRQGLEAPRQVWVHGFMTVQGEKMSKSRGNFLDPDAMVAAFGSDGTRFVTLREIPFDRDADVSWDSFVRRYNADLANDFGNLLNRTVSMTGRYLDGARPAPRPAAESPLAEGWAAAMAAYRDALEGCRLHEALAELWAFVGGANKTVDAEQPWVLAKAGKAGDAAAAARLAGVLGDLLEACRLVGLAVAPYMPGIAPRVLDQLGYAYPYGPDGNGGPPIADELS
ncbi:MAG: methionine--tRNA ligase, partial [Chloroflexota bacterium]